MKYFLIFFLIISYPALARQDSSAIVPRDPDLKYGRLKNGITYYVRQNGKPENRASFYLVRNVGSLMEEDDQNGMAHFLEHMAFNGTKNFPGQSLIKTLEKKGITFGEKINAYTNYNETVYNLSDIQTDDPGLIDTCLLILRDWSADISLEDSEIEKERGVIAEEYRTRKSGSLRTYFQTIAFILSGSKYAQRDIIGSMDVILKGPAGRMRDLYREWYRTDMQAVIVVGQIDPSEIEAKISKVFGPIPEIENPKERPFYEVPSFKGTRYKVITDKELTRSTISSYTLFYTGPRYPENKFILERSVIISLFNSMIRARITELLQKAEEPPFISGTIAYGSFIRGYETFYTSVSCDAGKEKTAFENLLIELEKIKRYGFTEAELEIAKNEMRGNLEDEFKSEKFNEEYVLDYKENYLIGTPVPSKEYEFRETNAILEGIKLEVINQKVKEWSKDDNRSVVLTGSEDTSVVHLSEKEVFNLMDRVGRLEITAYIDEDISKPLISADLNGSGIIRERSLKDFGAVEWQLKNNARVIYRYSDLEKNNVTFSAFSLGGTSLYPENMLESASIVPYLIPWFGLGDFDATSLQKKLKGRTVRLSPYFESSECLEGFRGSSSPEDFEVLMQLLYLHFEKPRFDSKAFENIIIRNIQAAANRYKDPANIISDSLTLILNDYNKRIKLSGTPDYYKKVRLDEVEKIYRDRIRDAGDFTFIIVGNIGADKVKELVGKYIGSINDDPRAESWIDNNVRWPEGRIEKQIMVKMDEPKSTVVINFNGILKYSPYNTLALDIISRILKIRYTEIIREREGGTYGIFCDGSLKHYPIPQASFMVYFDCKPENAEKLTELIYEEIEKFKKSGPSKDDLDKVLLAIRKEREEALKRNFFWDNAIFGYYLNKVNVVSDKNFGRIIDRMDVNQIRKISDRFFSGSDLAEIRFIPADE